MFALPLLLAGCSKDELGGEQTGDEITFEISFAGKMQTRVATDAWFDSTWEDGDEIGIFAVMHGEELATSGNYIDNERLTYDADTNTWSLDDGTALYWPQDGTALDFYAYHPYYEAFDATSNTFEVTAYQDEENNYNRSDLLMAKADNGGAGYAKGATIVPLGFVHALAMVQVTLDNETGLLDTDADITVTLRGVQRYGVVGLATTTAIALGEEGDITMYRLEQEGTPEYTTTFTYRALAPADQTFDAGTSLFRITDGTTTLQSAPLTESLTLVAGQAEIFGQQMPLPTIGKAVFTDGTTGKAYGMAPIDGIHEMVFGGTGGKTVYSVTIAGKTHLIGRKDNETVKLKIDPSTGDLLLREAVDDGSDIPKIPIGTYAEFAMIQTAVDGRLGHYLQEADLNLLGLLDAGSLDNPGLTAGDGVTRRNWTPIGDKSRTFHGSYDGGGHTISNLYIYYPDAEQIGLFGINDSRLSHIRVVSASVTAKENVGAVCGLNYGTIDDCHNNGSINGVNRVGSVCGQSAQFSSITACYNTGTVLGTGERVGGVVGFNHGSVDASRNSGSVNGVYYIGGICGDNGDFGRPGIITDCHNSGTINGNNYVGGVCGINDNGGDITACFNTGLISGDALIGGVCGTNSVASTVTACYNTGTVTGANEVGGVCSWNRGFITACYNTATVTGTDGLSEVGSVCSTAGSSLTSCWFLDRGIRGVGVGDDSTISFADDAWPTTDMEGWATGDGTTGGYWKAHSPSPLGGWISGGDPEGINSIFPKLWWEED